MNDKPRRRKNDYVASSGSAGPSKRPHSKRRCKSFGDVSFNELSRPVYDRSQEVITQPTEEDQSIATVTRGGGFHLLKRHPRAEQRYRFSVTQLINYQRCLRQY